MALLTVGWREWIGLPDLDIAALKAKIDTGARTSALHTFDIQTFHRDGQRFVRFGLHPVQRTDRIVHYAEAPVVDERMVSDSGGHREKRLVIETVLEMGGVCWPIEATLTSRDNMLFRMLIGRTAMRGRMLVDPQKSYMTGIRRIRAAKEIQT